MSEIDVADMVKWMEEEMNTFQTSRYVRFEHIAALIADWRKRGEALEPFAAFGIVGEGTATVDDIRDGLMRDRICDWFGPSDFDAARAAITPPQPQPAESTPIPSSQAK